MLREMVPYDLMRAAEERIRDIDNLSVTNGDNIGMLAVLQAERAALVAIREIERAKWDKYWGDEFDRLTAPDSCKICTKWSEENKCCMEKEVLIAPPVLCGKYKRRPEYCYKKMED